MLADLKIKDFLAETAADSPVSGGGSISALTGAIAAALTEMVANLTVGKKEYADYEGQMRTIAVEASTIRQRLIGYIEKDCEACDREIRGAAKESASISMQVAREIGSVMETIIYVAHKGNRDSVADACVAMMAARTCVLGALLNVRINLSSIEDENFVKQMKAEADHLETEAIRIETKLLDWMKTQL